MSLHNDPVWKAILHVKDELPVNLTGNGLISSEDFSLQKELLLSIQQLEANPDSRCQFPARVNFLKERLGLHESQLSLEKCTEYNDFLNNVPNTKTYLVYASENVKSASSMLGHIMLRMDGVNNGGIDVSHGITFFTEIEGFNIPKILIDSLFIGKAGYFQVAPYAEFVKTYLQKEERNIWEYELALSAKQKQLIRDITWELGQRDLSYFFHTYNCATVTQLLVASAAPESIDSLQSWLTPLDVVRFVEANNMVNQSRLIPSNEWQLRALLDNLPEEIINDSKKQISNGNIAINSMLSDEVNVLNLEFYKEYNQYLFNNDKLAGNDYKQNQNRITEQRARMTGYDIDVGDYKMPTSSSPEGLFALGVARVDERNWLQLNWFPVANSGLDNKKHVFGETTLALSDLRVLYSAESNNLRLEHWLLYNMHSRVPINATMKAYSTGFQFGLQRHFDDSLNRKLSAFVNGQLGFTYEFNQDVGVYAETGLGLGTNISETYLYVTPKIGSYLYLIGDLKWQSEFYVTINQLNSTEMRQSLSHSLSWNLSHTLQLTGEYQQHKIDNYSKKEFSFLVRYRF